MTAPGDGNVIARAFVEVVPDVRNFARQLNRELRQATRSLRQLDRDVDLVNRGLARTARTITGINTALPLTRQGFRALAVEAVVGGLIAVGGALAEASGALAVVPAVAVGAAAGLGTLVVGLHGVEDALKDFEDPQAFNKSLRELSRNARQTLGVLNEFRPELRAFRDAVQDALFADLAPVARQLGETFLPRVRSNFVAIATAMNQVAREVAAFALLPATVADVDVTSRNVVRSFQLMRPAGVAAARALRDFVAVGSQFLPVLAGLVTSIAVRLSQVVAEARQSGVLADFMARGIAASLQFGRILFNVGRGLRAILFGARQAGVGLLNTVENLTDKFADFFESVRGQAALQTFLLQARAAALALAPVIGAVIELIVGDLLPILTDFAETVGPAVVFFINALGTAVDLAAPGIHDMAEGFSAFLLAIAPVLPVLGELVSAIGTFLGQVFQTAGPAIAELASAIATALIPVIQTLTDIVAGLTTEQVKWILGIALVIFAIGTLLSVIRGGLTVLNLLLGAFGFLLSPLGLILIAVAGLVVLFIRAWQNSDTFRDAVRRLGEAFGKLLDALGDLFDALAPIVEDLLPVLLKLLDAIAPILGPLIDLLTPFIELLAFIIRQIVNLMELLADAIELGVDLLSQFGVPLLDAEGSFKRSSDAITEDIGRVGSALGSNGRAWVEWAFGIQHEASGAAGSAAEFATSADDSLGRVGSSLGLQGRAWAEWAFGIGHESGGAAGSVAGFATSAEGSLGRVGTAISNFVGRLRNAFGPEVGGAVGSGISQFNSFHTGVVGVLGRVVGAASSAISQVGSIFRGQDFSAAGSGLIESLARGMRNAIASAVAAAKAAAAAIARALPGSPAEIGAFSGRGWTPFRGRALVEGLAEGITSNVDLVRDAALRVVAAAGAVLPTETRLSRLTVPPVTLPTVGRDATSTANVSTLVQADVRVFVGERELRDVVATVTTDERRESRRAVLTGVRRSP